MKGPSLNPLDILEECEQAQAPEGFRVRHNRMAISHFSEFATFEWVMSFSVPSFRFQHTRIRLRTH